MSHRIRARSKISQIFCEECAEVAKAAKQVTIDAPLDAEGVEQPPIESTEPKPKSRRRTSPAAWNEKRSDRAH